MSKITIHQLEFYYSDYYHPIFRNVNLVLDTDWRLGLIGRNGRGKSTFFHLLAGKLKPVHGQISMSVNMEYFPYETSCGYHAALDVLKEVIGGLKSMEDRMEQIISGDQTDRYEEYSEIQLKYSELGGYEMESRIFREMAAMGLHEKLAYRDYAALSGGERTRMLIIALFLRKNSFVLLDEPTNHLDIGGKEMLAEYLRKKNGFIVVSHDREFLDKVTDHILAINKTDIQVEKGNYSAWRRNMDIVEEYEFRTRDKLEREINQLESRSKRSRNWAGEANKQKYAFASHARTNGTRSYMRQAKRSEEQIHQNIEDKKKLLLNYEAAKELKLMQYAADTSDWLINAEKLSFAYEEGEPIIRELQLKIYPGDRIWIKGRNGAGKSTLLKLLSGELEAKQPVEYAEGLTIAAASQEPRWTEGFIREKYSLPGQQAQLENLISYCEAFDLPDDFLDRPLETYSSGEQKKIDIARVLSEESSVIFLDEPLNYMDVYFREQLERAILKSQPTIAFVEHDGMFGKNVSNRIIELGSAFVVE